LNPAFHALADWLIRSIDDPHAMAAEREPAGDEPQRSSLVWRGRLELAGHGHRTGDERSEESLEEARSVRCISATRSPFATPTSRNPPATAVDAVRRSPYVMGISLPSLFTQVDVDPLGRAVCVPA
jgi:hypothetical protein